MAGLPYEEQIQAHRDTKPYSIDPFNELETPEKERDALLVRDFLASYENLSKGITEKISQRYFNIGQEFG